MTVPRPGELDLHAGLRHGARSLGLAALCGAAFGLLMALADAGPFRAAVPEVQRILIAEVPLGPRLALFLRGALSDEVLLRLLGMSGTVWVLVVLAGGLRRWIHPVAIAGMALLLWPVLARGYLAQLDWSTLTLLRELLLHGGAGALWGWLYWRHGWLAGLAGHCSAHLVLQPALTLLA